MFSFMVLGFLPAPSIISAFMSLFCVMSGKVTAVLLHNTLENAPTSCREQAYEHNMFRIYFITFRLLSDSSQHPCLLKSTNCHAHALTYHDISKDIIDGKLCLWRWRRTCLILLPACPSLHRQIPGARQIIQSVSSPSGPDLCHTGLWIWGDVFLSISPPSEPTTDTS